MTLVALKETLMQKIKGKLVDDAHEWHRWWSMRWILIAAALEALKTGWADIPAEWTAALPVWVHQHLAIAALFSTAMAAVSRVYKQQAPQDKESSE
jgi:hypothetical protein